MRREWRRRTATVGSLLLVFAGIVVFGPVGDAMADDFRFRLQFSYVDGIDDLADLYEDNIEEVESSFFDVVDVDTFVWPVGLSVFPYYQWDNGLMVGVGVGPFLYVLAEGFVEDDYNYWQVPVNVSVGYVFFPDEPISFYVRGGPSYHFAGGDFYDGSNLGFVVAGGAEFLKTDNITLGVEAAYDSAEVDIDDLRNGGTKGIKTNEFCVGLFIQF